MLVVDSNRGGVVGMLKEHLGIVLGLKIPFVVCVTKTICAPTICPIDHGESFALVKRTWGYTRNRFLSEIVTMFQRA